MLRACCGRRAFPGGRRIGVSLTGLQGKANVGISNENGGANPPHRKAKVSSAMAVIGGLVGV